MKSPVTPPSAARRRPILRFRGAAGMSDEDLVTVEEPLEIRIAGQTLAVTMRTPGSDRELALGFLLSEGLVRSASDVKSIAESDDAIDVTLAAHAPEASMKGRRGTLTTSACGVCGRTTIEDLIARCHPVEDTARFAATAVAGMTASLREAQVAFGETGGLHAAALATSAGRLSCVREDVGRHNAVDKVVGRLLQDGALPATGHGLVVSGRSSFEIVQKAVMAGIPLVVSVSAPSTLAIETAERAGVTLVGFSRGETFNVYAHAERLY